MWLKCDQYYWKQVFVLSAVLLQVLSVGVFMAYPSAMNPSLLSPNSSDIRATADQASWLAASIGISSGFGCIVLPALMQSFGRKPVHIIVNTIHLLGWLAIYFANSITWLFIGRFLQGVGFGSLQINSLIVSEYSNPISRGYFITLKKVFAAIGGLICHGMAMLLPWRTIGAFALAAPTLAIIMTLFWPESPSYYAMKGRFSECEKSFTWLFGCSLQQKNELMELISGQMARLNKTQNEKSRVTVLFKNCLMRDLQRAILIVSLLTIAIDACGRYFFIAYVIEIMMELVGDKSVALYYSVAADSLTILALFLSCFIIRYFKRRNVLFVFGTISVFAMLMLSLMLVLKMKYKIASNLVWLTPCIILFQSFTANLSIVPLGFTLMGEIIPLEHRGVGTCLSGIVFSIFYVITLKITPMMMKDIGLEGVYLVYGICLLFVLVVLYFILPETKDRTLQDIEDELKGVNRTTAETKAILS